MSLPITFDYSGGIRVWGWQGNAGLGDCVQASLEDLRMAKATVAGSAVDRVLYRVGFRPPRSAYTTQVYTQYLATLGEKPGPDVGTNVNDFLQYGLLHQPRPLILGWARVPLSGSDRDATIRALALQFTGCLVTIELTQNAYQHFYAPIPWHVGPGPLDQPVPALLHEVAVVRATKDFTVVTTWDQNKLATPAFMDACAVGAHVVLTDSDMLAPDWAQKYAALQALPGGTVYHAGVSSAQE